MRKREREKTQLLLLPEVVISGCNSWNGPSLLGSTGSSPVDRLIHKEPRSLLVSLSLSDPAPYFL